MELDLRKPRKKPLLGLLGGDLDWGGSLPNLDAKDGASSDVFFLTLGEGVFVESWSDFLEDFLVSDPLPEEFRFRMLPSAARGLFPWTPSLARF